MSLFVPSKSRGNFGSFSQPFQFSPSVVPHLGGPMMPFTSSCTGQLAFFSTFLPCHPGFLEILIPYSRMSHMRYAPCVRYLSLTSLCLGCLVIVPSMSTLMFLSPPLRANSDRLSIRLNPFAAPLYPFPQHSHRILPRFPNGPQNFSTFPLFPFLKGNMP